MKAFLISIKRQGARKWRLIASHPHIVEINGEGVMKIPDIRGVGWLIHINTKHYVRKN